MRTFAFAYQSSVLIGVATGEHVDEEFVHFVEEAAINDTLTDRLGYLILRRETHLRPDNVQGMIKVQYMAILSEIQILIRTIN